MSEPNPSEEKQNDITVEEKQNDNTTVESVTFDVAPGTVHLVDLEGDYEDIVLSPQPSDDPNDPLNWSRSRKILNMTMVLFYVFSAGGIAATSVYPIFVEINEATGISIADMNTGNGLSFLLSGFGLLISMPLSQKFGRRPAYLISLLGCLATSEWLAHVNTSASYILCESLYGLFLSPVGTLPAVCINEVFFAHERGTWIGMYMLVFLASSYLGPIISAAIAEAAGWRWAQHWCAILLAFNVVVAVFFQEESLYNRKSGEGDVTEETFARGVITLKSERRFAEGHQSKTFMEKLKLYVVNKDINNKQLFRMVWEPFYILVYFPLILWCGFCKGLGLSWYNVFNGTASMIFSDAPYNFSSRATGFTFFAPLMGAVLAGIYCGPVVDRLVIGMAKKNGGIREPEHRLWAFTLYLITAPAGLFIWGIGAYYQVHWILLCFAGFLLGFAIVLPGACTMAYLIDSYRGISFSAVTSLILVRNTIQFSFSYGITPWIEAQGLKNTFVVAGILAFVTGLTYLVPIWKGKAFRCRSAGRYYQLIEEQVIHHT